MQIKCYSCHIPFAINKDTAHAALDTIAAEKLNHFNANCPRCRKVNRISRQQLLRAAPNWVSPEKRKD
jgi:phage FluMu protein Com